MAAAFLLTFGVCAFSQHATMDFSGYKARFSKRFVYYHLLLRCMYINIGLRTRLYIDTYYYAVQTVIFVQFPLTQLRNGRGGSARACKL